jgi:hypothetical protein
MQRSICSILFVALIAGLTQAQTPAAPPSSTAETASKVDRGDDLFPPHKHNGKVGLVRGVLKRVDPIYDQLVVHTFGDGDIRIAFDGQTKLLAENADTRLSNIPAGSVLSVDTVIDDGKVFASFVRIGTAASAELNGQVVRYDPSRSQLTLRDPISPENISLRVTSSTKVVNRGQATTAQNLSPGMLVRVWYGGAQNVANEVEVLAARGDSFAFEGRIVALDLRSRVLSLSNNTDQSLRELTFGSLDSNSLSLLREGAQVSIQAEFDGEHYKVRAVSPAPQNQ